MTITAEMIRSMIHTLPLGVSVEVWIADGVNAIREIKQDLERLRQERKELDRAYEERCREIALKRNHVEARCPHYSTAYHFDPAGVFDSFTECDLCGAEFKGSEMECR